MWRRCLKPRTVADNVRRCGLHSYATLEGVPHPTAEYRRSRPHLRCAVGCSIWPGSLPVDYLGRYIHGCNARFCGRSDILEGQGQEPARNHRRVSGQRHKAVHARLLRVPHGSCRRRLHVTAGRAHCIQYPASLSRIRGFREHEL